MLTGKVAIVTGAGSGLGRAGALALAEAGARVLAEAIGMTMIGEGILALVHPRGHTMLWLRGPRAWRAMVEPFARHPGITQCLGATEAVLGYLLAARQMEPRC